MAFSLRRKDRAGVMLANVLKEGDPPSMPSVALKILGRLRDPDVEFDEVGESLSWDPALTTKVLATVNSAAYAPAQPIADVRQALSYLGRTELEQIVLAVAVRSALPVVSVPGFDETRFWKTAARRAALGRAIAERLHPAESGETFTSSLLLDMAIPAMVHGIGERYSNVLQEWHATPGSELHEIERDKLGVTHTRVGSLLVASWELPESLADIIAKHHEPGVSDRVVPAAVQLMSHTREAESDDANDKLIELARNDYGLEPDWTLGVIEASEVAAGQLAELLGA